MSVAAGVNVMDLRNGINKAVDAVLSHLKSKAWMISTPQEITQVWDHQKDSIASYHILGCFLSFLYILS